MEEALDKAMEEEAREEEEEMEEEEEEEMIIPEPSYAEFKIRSSDFPEVKHPNIRRDIDEVRRLMKHPLAPDVLASDSCAICRSHDHLHMYCPCLDKIEEGVVLGPFHDSICLGCGKIGETCCNQGAYAVPKVCFGCTCFGHWYWESRCNKADIKPWAVPLPSIDGVKPPPTAYENYETDDDEIYYCSSAEEGDTYILEEVTSDSDSDCLQNKEDELVATPAVSTGAGNDLMLESETSARGGRSKLLNDVGEPGKCPTKKRRLRRIRANTQKVFDEVKKLGI